MAIDTTHERADLSVSCTVTTALLDQLTARVGSGAVTALLAGSSEHSAADLRSAEKRIDHRDLSTLLQQAVLIGGDPSLPFAVGTMLTRRQAGTPVATLLRGLGSIEAALTAYVGMLAHQNGATDLTVAEIEPGRALIVARARPGATTHPVHCQWLAGALAPLTELFGLAPARVSEPECQARGDDRCGFVLLWDSAEEQRLSDPRQHVTQLESGLVTIGERLRVAVSIGTRIAPGNGDDDGVQATLDQLSALPRAPAYALALRPGGAEDWTVSSSGIDPAVAAPAVADSLAGRPALDRTVMWSDVPMAPGAQARLLALFPQGSPIGPLEQICVDLYAHQFSQALARLEAERRAKRSDDHLNALVTFVQGAGERVLPGEVATRLAEHAPPIIDCDVVELWLNDPETGTFIASGDPATAPAERSPAVIELLEHGELVAADEDTFEPFLAYWLKRTGSTRVLASPIRCGGTTRAALLAGVRERPERLRTTPELTFRLTGLAAIAGTLLDNEHDGAGSAEPNLP